MVELKKTTWPSRNELAKSTAVIMITIVTVAIFLSVVDQIAMRLAAVAFNVK